MTSRVERYRAIIALQRRFPPTEALQHDASVAVSVRVVSVPFDRTIVTGERFLESPDDTQCIAAFVVSLGVRRVECDDLIVWQNCALIILRRYASRPPCERHQTRSGALVRGGLGAGGDGRRRHDSRLSGTTTEPVAGIASERSMTPS